MPSARAPPTSRRHASCGRAGLGALARGLRSTVIAPREDMPNIIARFDAPRPGRPWCYRAYRHCPRQRQRMGIAAPTAAHHRRPLHGLGACRHEVRLASSRSPSLASACAGDRSRLLDLTSALSDEETLRPWGAPTCSSIPTRPVFFWAIACLGEPSSSGMRPLRESRPYWMRHHGAHSEARHGALHLPAPARPR